MEKNSLKSLKASVDFYKSTDAFNDFEKKITKQNENWHLDTFKVADFNKKSFKVESWKLMMILMIWFWFN